jgi:hypothetical protein
MVVPYSQGMPGAWSGNRVRERRSRKSVRAPSGTGRLKFRVVCLPVLILQFGEFSDLGTDPARFSRIQRCRKVSKFNVWPNWRKPKVSKAEKTSYFALKTTDSREGDVSSSNNSLNPISPTFCPDSRRLHVGHKGPPFVTTHVRRSAGIVRRHNSIAFATCSGSSTCNQ